MAKSRFFTFFLYASCCVTTPLFSIEPKDASATHRQALLARIHPKSLRDLLLFASLYPDSSEGASALRQAWAILSNHNVSPPPPLPPNFGITATTLVRLVQPSLQPGSSPPEIPQETIAFIEQIGASLPHRSLKGHSARSLEELETLLPEDIDLSRALILLDGPLPQEMTSVEASLDILALEILSRVGQNATEEEKIGALTQLLFEDLKVRFPPESEAEEKTKQFSDLSSVLFSRRGICLGASVLYLSLAQRIGVPLIIYTPPGHIFVAHKGASRIRVIETTARGIDIPLERYLGLTLKSLPERSIKEVVGMVMFNRAADQLKKKSWKEALDLYHRAERFERDDELSLMVSLCDLLDGRAAASVRGAKTTLKSLSDHRLEPDLLLVDLSEGTISKGAAEAVIMWSDPRGDDAIQAIESFQKLLAECPKSYIVPLHLAYSWLNRGKTREAIPLIERLAQRPDAPCSLYTLLAELHYSRMNLPAAWENVKKASVKARQKGMLPKPLHEFIQALHEESPSCEEAKNLLYGGES